MPNSSWIAPVRTFVAQQPTALRGSAAALKAPAAAADELRSTVQPVARAAECAGIARRDWAGAAR